jgi:hypothetical protein
MAATNPTSLGTRPPRPLLRYSRGRPQCREPTMSALHACAAPLLGSPTPDESHPKNAPRQIPSKFRTSPTSEVGQLQERLSSHFLGPDFKINGLCCLKCKVFLYSPKFALSNETSSAFKRSTKSEVSSTRSNATARWPSETGSPPRNNVSVSASRQNGPRMYVADRSSASSETLKNFFSAVS